MSALARVVLYGAICSGALIAGGGIAAYWPPRGKTSSYVQHVAAGFVFAAVGVEVLPEVLERNLPGATGLGFALGVALMLVIRAGAQKLEADGGQGGVNWAFTGVVMTDLFVDGVLIGVSSVTERGDGKQALLVTVALACELLSLGLSMAANLGASGLSHARTLLVTCAISVWPLLGAVGGHFLGAALSGAAIEGILAFAAAAFLYMATEELLKEAHEVPETLLSTTLFFAAFLAMLLIAMMSPSGGS